MFCYVLTACACLNSCNLGYDIGSVGGAALLMQEHLGWSEWELSFYVGSINFFCIIGAMNAGLFCDRFGRVKTFTMSCVIFIVGLLIQVLATKYVEPPNRCIGRWFLRPYLIDRPSFPCVICVRTYTQGVVQLCADHGRPRHRGDRHRPR